MYRHKSWRFSSLLAIMLAMVVLISGCAPAANVMVRDYQVPLQPIDPPAPAAVKAPEGIENAVPVEPQLNYIDTKQLMAIYHDAKPISQNRTKYEEYATDWDFVIVDSRPVGKYNEAHINGAINIPDAQFEEFANRLPEDKTIKLIFYCGGWTCPLSPASANKAIALGYTDVLVYQEGTEGWFAAHNYFVTTPEYVATKITEDYMMNAAKPIKIIDARPYASYFQAHIPMAYPIDDSIFSQFSKSFPTDKSTEIIIYCGGFFCAKSHNEAKLLLSLGYTDIKVLAGGLPAWKQAGMPTFGTESSGISFDISGGKANLALNAADWKKKFDAGNVVVVDVRTEDERATGAITNSVHIVDKDILADASIIKSKLPADKNVTVLIHCASGARASGVAAKFVEQGYANSFYLNNAIKISADGSFSF